MKKLAINRRNFLKGAAATLALSHFNSMAMEGLDPTKTYKVGLIGTGWYGKSDLFRLIQVANVEVLALCDVDKNILNAAADLVSKRQKSGKRPNVYGDYKKMLAENKMDIVLIGTPDHWHALQIVNSHEFEKHPTRTQAGLSPLGSRIRQVA